MVWHSMINVWVTVAVRGIGAGPFAPGNQRAADIDRIVKKACRALCDRLDRQSRHCAHALGRRLKAGTTLCQTCVSVSAGFVFVHAGCSKLAHGQFVEVMENKGFGDVSLDLPMPYI
jgi:hypothetical protein